MFKSKLKFVVLLIILLFSFTGCVYDRGLILFNSAPITKDNVLNDDKYFKDGTRIYYLFIAPKKMKTDLIRVQVFKMTDKAPWGGNEVVRTKDCRLMSDERYYHTDYFVFYEKGRYVMQVFSHEDFQHPLALNDFYIQ